MLVLPGHYQHYVEGFALLAPRLVLLLLAPVLRCHSLTRQLLRKREVPDTRRRCPLLLTPSSLMRQIISVMLNLLMLILVAQMLMRSWREVTRDYTLTSLQTKSSNRNPQGQFSIGQGYRCRMHFLLI